MKRFLFILLLSALVSAFNTEVVENNWKVLGIAKENEEIEIIIEKRDKTIIQYSCKVVFYNYIEKKYKIVSPLYNIILDEKEVFGFTITEKE